MQELIRCPSVSGQEDKVVEAIKKELSGTLGYDDCYVDCYGNVIGHIKVQEKERLFLFDGHIDTVPVTDELKWKFGPFCGEISEGRIYGRGASDMKGQVSAMISAAAYFAEGYKKEFDGDIYVAGVVHEEIFEGVAARKISDAINPTML